MDSGLGAAGDVSDWWLLMGGRRMDGERGGERERKKDAGGLP